MAWAAIFTSWCGKLANRKKIASLFTILYLRIKIIVPIIIYTWVPIYPHLKAMDL